MTITRRLATLAAAAAPMAALDACGAPPAPQTSAVPLVVNDQSRLNATRVSRHLTLADHQEGGDLEDRVRASVRQAASDERPVCFAGARHSMGGQSLPPSQGVAVDMATRLCRIETAAGVYTVDAGARWREVIAELDPHGLSPAVMQSNNDFAVGGAIGVNAHGWPVPHGPVSSTVRSLRLVLADGAAVIASPTENPDLFAACLGGYGLFGALVSAQLAYASNVLLDRTQVVLPVADFARRFTQAVHAPDVRMAYGRLSLAKDDFLTQALLTAFRPAAHPPARLPPASGASAFDGLTRSIFRNQTGSDAGKRLRWWAETNLSGALPSTATRNSIMNTSVRSIAGSDFRRTDILHEYFVPPPAVESFLGDCGRLIPASDQDLLNVTLRWVEADTQSLLAFAPQARIALVMFFSHRMTAAAESDMRRLTERLIDAALAAGGSFYLPYRLHARPDQLRRAYPRLGDFVAAKRRWDPDLRFRNLMWDRYFGAV